MLAPMNCCLQPLTGAAMVMVISMVALSMALSSRDDLLSPLPLLQIGYLYYNKVFGT